MVTLMDVSDRVGRRIRLHDLHVLLAVVQAGSMNKAAALLNTGQSAISRSIADLEHAIGAPLLDRTPQGVGTTAYGRALLNGAAAMFDDLRQAVKAIEFLADPSAGEVRIGSIIPLAASFVSAVVDPLSLRHPRIVFHLETGAQETLQRDLCERHLDILIAWGPITDDRLAFEFLYDDSYVVVAGQQNPWVRRRKIKLAELIDEPWTLQPPSSVLGSLFIEAFRSSGLDYPRATVISMPGEVRNRLLATGRFLSILPASALKFSAERPEIRVLPVELPPARLPVGIVTLKNRTLSPVAQLFIEHARQVAKPLVKKDRQRRSR
jgi:DNA-binding transcriptional LysR family regulator